ncbi:MAG: tRNA-(ms[2]io[6]A)-hydroxylase [Cellvibrionales bacterium]|nr:tRNA-(ms[2]io[6]A)-hydroxylase [Cellvibrionales bacterium]
MDPQKHLQPILDFLPCRTPQAWAKAAAADLPTLLIDHANCEKKAAATALALIHRYPQDPKLLHQMSRLVREELRHFEQVLSLLQERQIPYAPLSASRYAAALHRHIRSKDPARLIDHLIIGAIIEARSCERFFTLLDHLDPKLRTFYQSLLTSEARHFQTYLKLAQQTATNTPNPKQTITTRTTHFLTQEKELIETPDNQLRFHSGPPA